MGLNDVAWQKNCEKKASKNTLKQWKTMICSVTEAGGESLLQPPCAALLIEHFVVLLQGFDLFKGLDFKLSSELPGENGLEPAIHAVYVVLPAPDKIPELILRFDGVIGVENVVGKLAEFGKIHPGSGAVLAGLVSHKACHVDVDVLPHPFAVIEGEKIIFQGLLNCRSGGPPAHRLGVADEEEEVSEILAVRSGSTGENPVFAHGDFDGLVPPVFVDLAFDFVFNVLPMFGHDDYPFLRTMVVVGT